MRAVLQAEEPHGTRELAKCTWIHRLHTNEDKSALFKLAQKASLVPTCPVVKPTFLLHNCDSLACSWFAPQGGWDAIFSAAPNNFAGFNVFYMWSLDAEVDAVLYDYVGDFSYGENEWIKMAIILPTGQWYAPSAVINDAWYCMVLHCIA